MAALRRTSRPVPLRDTVKGRDRRSKRDLVAISFITGRNASRGVVSAFELPGNLSFMAMSKSGVVTSFSVDSHKVHLQILMRG